MITRGRREGRVAPVISQNLPCIQPGSARAPGVSLASKWQGR